MKRFAFAEMTVLIFLISLFLSACSRDAITVDGEGISKEVYNAVLKDKEEGGLKGSIL